MADTVTAKSNAVMNSATAEEVGAKLPLGLSVAMTW